MQSALGASGLWQRDISLWTPCPPSCSGRHEGSTSDRLVRRIQKRDVQTHISANASIGPAATQAAPVTTSTTTSSSNTSTWSMETVDEDWAFESTTVGLSSSKALKINLDLKLVSGPGLGVWFAGDRRGCVGSMCVATRVQWPGGSRLVLCSMHSFVQHAYVLNPRHLLVSVLTRDTCRLAVHHTAGHPSNHDQQSTCCAFGTACSPVAASPPGVWAAQLCSCMAPSLRLLCGWLACPAALMLLLSRL